MSGQHPTLIDMPDPPSNPETPSEMPGTPNSTTTSLSVLSTTAIKDGHRGTSHPSFTHPSHLGPSTSTNLEAERADRISRLAGLERVSTVRPHGPGNASLGSSGGVNTGQIPGYFDANGNPVYTTRMSTVGTASATGSQGGRTTTWASGSVDGESRGDAMSTDQYTPVEGGDAEDRMSMLGQSEDGDADRMSEGNDDASLVGFGEGAGSTVSGPISSRAGLGHGGALGTEAAQRIVKERLDQGEGLGRPNLGTPDKDNLGKFYFEDKK